jgi:hypothetical protein
VTALALCQQNHVHSPALCYEDLVRKDRSKVWGDGRHQNTASASHHVQDSWLEGAPHGERVDMARYSKRHGAPLGLGHNPVDNCGLALMDSVLRSVHCARRSCLCSLLNTTCVKVSEVRYTHAAILARSFWD